MLSLSPNKAYCKRWSTLKFYKFSHYALRVLTVDKSSRKMKQIGSGDGADISVHGSNVCPPELNAKSNTFPASHQTWFAHPTAQHPKHRNSKTAPHLGRLVESPSKRRHPKYLPPLAPQEDPLCIVAKHVDMAVGRQTSSKNSKCFQSEDHIPSGFKSAPTAKREHSWPLVSSQNLGRIRLNPIADKHRWHTCRTQGELGDRDPVMTFSER